jgi:hypothetical protein
MEAGAVANDLHRCNLFLCGGLETLQLFAGNQVAAAITQFENEQIQSGVPPVLHA